MFDLKGSIVAKVFDHPTSAAPSLQCLRFPLAANIKLHSHFHWTKFLDFSLSSIKNGLHAFTLKSISSPTESGWLTKIETTVDTLKITAAGYAPSDTAISSYQTMVNVTLDSMSLGKFSFFVTSLEGLQTLSGNVKGFGGDLRFGKTGQGADFWGRTASASVWLKRACLARRLKKAGVPQCAERRERQAGERDRQDWNGTLV